MSELIQHNCGVAFIRQLKEPAYYREKYGSSDYAVNKLYILMSKMRNRGHSGSGIASVSLNKDIGEKYISRRRIAGRHATEKLFNSLGPSFGGDILIGHVRYGTYGKNDFHYCHPKWRRSNWKHKSLLLAGNFNLTNIDEIIADAVKHGAHPTDMSDTSLILEKFGFELDKEVGHLFEKYNKVGKSSVVISENIVRELSLSEIVKRSVGLFQGGYALVGVTGSGHIFFVRDPNGIRPAYYYIDDEFIVGASERVAIQSTFEVSYGEIKKVDRGTALIVDPNGSYHSEEVIEPAAHKSCSFGRVYFARGNDAKIYKERKMLGKYLASSVAKSINYDFRQSVFTYVPNAAEVAFYGMREELERILDRRRLRAIKLSKGTLSEIINEHVRSEYIVIKDEKFRTFISEDNLRVDLASKGYDITYGVLNEFTDNLVVLDDSIVRGTTLKESIIYNLGKLNPKKIIVVSSAPQIRYPDCYGIDISKVGEFIAFRAAIELLKLNGRELFIRELYQVSLAELQKEDHLVENKLKEIYLAVDEGELLRKIAELVTPADFTIPVEVIYQSVKSLNKALPDDQGDWYFTGEYPTFGGNRVANQSFINWYEGREGRSY